MESEASPAIPARQPVARVVKAGIIVGWIIMATEVLALVVASRFSPAALAAITAAIACMAGVFAVLYRATGQWARDPGYALSGKRLALVLALAAVSIVLIFWSTSL